MKTVHFNLVKLPALPVTVDTGESLLSIALQPDDEDEGSLHAVYITHFSRTKHSVLTPNLFVMAQILPGGLRFESYSCTPEHGENVEVLIKMF